MDVDVLLRPQREALAALLRSDALEEEDAQRAIAEVVEVAARTLHVERVGAWRVADDRSALQLVDLFERRSHTHTGGLRLSASDAPQYFEALMQQRSIAAHDARNDPRTADFREQYLEPNGITSMLDAPILVRGRLRGVICHEHVGPRRRWSPWEELVAATFADFISMIFAAEELIGSRRELEGFQRQLQSLVEERSARLRQSEEDIGRLFEASPVALVLTSVNDQRVVEANQRAAELFGVPLQRAKGQRAPSFWVNPADRDALLTQIAESGVVASFQAELKRADGSRFWGEIDAQSISFGGRASLLVGVRDVTATRNAERTTRTLIEAAPVPLVLTSLDTSMVRFANRAAAAMFECAVDDIVGRNARDFYENPDDRLAFLEKLKLEGRVDNFTVRLKTARGHAFWALLNASTLDLNGERAFMVGFQDLSEQKDVEAKLRELATVDALTGALNRRRFFEVAEEEMLRADRYGGEVSLAMIDADHFKVINDCYGHAAGDAALQHIARVLRDGLRRTDVVGRYGGEEFCVLLPATDLDQAAKVIDTLRARIAEAIGDVRVTISAGVATRMSGESLASMLKRADDAMYRAKAAGRNRLKRA